MITVVEGEILDVAVDLRKNSKTFGQHVAFRIKYDSNFSIYIPEGFAHGFLTLSDEAYFEYKCTDYYNKSDEGVINCKDPDLNIPWPSNINTTISQKDEAGKSFQDFIGSLK